jgi:hypothetical protein
MASRPGTFLIYVKHNQHAKLEKGEPMAAAGQNRNARREHLFSGPPPKADDVWPPADPLHRLNGR